MGKKSGSKKDVKPVSEAQPDETQGGRTEQDSAPPMSKAQVNEAFGEVYLRQVTKEFADDLEKLRTGNDFKGEKSVQTLINALTRGTACFSTDEKLSIVRG